MGTTIFDEYQRYTEKYQHEYGKNTLVLMEVGSFYEMYATDDSKIDLYSVGNLLNIQVTRKNKSIPEVSRSNYMLAGFPSYCLDKFTNILLDNQYTIVLVSQTTPPPKPQRSVTSILSPGMRIEPAQPNENSFLMCIFLDDDDGGGLLMGVSYIDVSTGEVFVSEAGNSFDQVIEVLQKTLTAVSPKEILIVGNIDHSKYETVAKRLALDRTRSGCTIHVKIDRIGNATTDAMNNKHFRQQLLQTAYPNHGLFNVIEYLGLERHPIALSSFVHLLAFAHQHREDVLLNIRKPVVLQTEDKLFLSHDAYRHLDVLPKREGNGGLIHLLNRCMTSIGKRGFRRRLLNPYIDVSILKDMYDTVESLIQKDNWQRIRQLLTEVCDLERCFRRIDLGTLQWQCIPTIHDSLSVVKLIAEECQQQNILTRLTTDVGPTIDSIFDAYSAVLDIDKLVASPGGLDSPFLRGFDAAIDKLERDLAEKLEFVKRIGSELNGGVDPVFKLERNEKDGFYFAITAKRFKTFQAARAHETLPGTKIEVKKLVAKTVSSTSSLVKVTHDALRAASHDIVILEEGLRKLVQERYRTFLQHFARTCRIAFDLVVEFVEAIDFFTTNAANAIKFSYCRPFIDEGAEGESFIDCKNLRHPIIERVQDGIPYVANDIHIGGGGNTSSVGMLLFGINASGKSSLMKSVGLALIMACAGMYVPCSSMRFYPYTRIFTRIPSGDDLFAGHSTFTQEISELRSILNKADNKSLVIGDELCSGTEPTSAIAIVAAGILRLIDKGTSFIFASHLHEIVNLPQISSLSPAALNVCHLGVRYDGSKLVYDRVLKPGSGDTLYGIEVCRALDLEPEFMKIAQSIRHQILSIEPNIVSTKRTRYNAKVFKEAKCKICKHNKASEVHHIIEQNVSDKNGIVLGRFHKNAKHNLVNICEACHQSVHNGQINVKGYMQTSSGIELMIEKNEPGL